MSDVEYEYDSPYEDLHDILYDADQGPDMADTLAENALYSPVWQDDVNGELKDYFSDWEYYSDDYYDDDPAILNSRIKQSTEENAQVAPKRGRKRKLVEVRERNSRAFDSEEQRSLQKSLRGTVWLQVEDQQSTTYVEGQHEKIALRLSRSVMQSAYSYDRGFGKKILKRDDSWANELGLDEMGLQPQLPSNVQQEASVVDDAEEDEFGEESGPDNTEEQDMGSHDDNDGTSNSHADKDIDMDDKEEANVESKATGRRGKRRRADSTSPVYFTNEQRPETEQKSASVPPKKPQTSPRSGRKAAKRKAETGLEEDGDDEADTQETVQPAQATVASRRVKRVAASKLSSTILSDGVNANISTPARATRSKKK